MKKKDIIMGFIISVLKIPGFIISSELISFESELSVNLFSAIGTIRTLKTRKSIKLRSTRALYISWLGAELNWYWNPIIPWINTIVE